MIKHVRIGNFKSLVDVSVDLEPVTVLIGRSGTGKSNFVAALRFLRDYLYLRHDQFVNQMGGWSHILPATAVYPITLSFAITFRVPTLDEDYCYDLAFVQTSPYDRVALREERLACGGHVLFHQKPPQWLQAPPLFRAPQPGSPMLGTLTGIPEVTVAYLALTTGLGCYAFSNTVLLESGTALGPQTGLVDSGANYLQVLYAVVNNLPALDNWRHLTAGLRVVNPSVRGVEPRLPEGRIAVSHQVGDQLLVLDLNQESEGLRRLLAYLIALYQLPPKQTLVFEEPEKGLHPGALEALAWEFNRCPEAGRGQVLLTTHSPELLNHFAPEQLRVLEMQDHQTRIGPVSPEQIESLRDHLLLPGELLTVDPARLTTAAIPAE